MAEQELHDTDAEAQKDWQDAADDADVAEDEQREGAENDAKDDADDAKGEHDEAKDDDSSKDEDDDFGVPMDKVEAILNATADKASLNPQMQRMMARQAENTKRVEESIKGTKANPGWFVPLFCALMIIGLVWAVVYYLTYDYPIPNIGAWNLAIAFAIIMAGFLMTMWWR
ncbi:septation inhibitor protein [Bifidobacterium sp. DSM 109958]|uniref:Cell division protein CrgA n=1 Tax=Bifidobacterium moraviense TaxID=2675323 RepID=A0A7Y0F4E1_9BIFI|nr:cell division protein CrgA [Bifidobacterium sp. DSM 109958]NMN00857.1 septation inhibitor protein [Bifidobacterium sp. DSM 109958]